MMKKIVLVIVILSMTMSLASLSVGVNDTFIDSLGAAFLSGDNSYLPLKNVTSFLGASLGWDAAKSQAVMTYDGQQLALTPNSRNATFAGKPVVLPTPTVIVNGVTYIPAKALNTCYKIPVTWDRGTSVVKIKGPKGWGTARASRRPPWHGGPPPWAPAWGERRKHGANFQAPDLHKHETRKVKQTGNDNTMPGMKPSAHQKSKENKQGKGR